jgi:hypothetical protein
VEVTSTLSVFREDTHSTFCVWLRSVRLWMYREFADQLKCMNDCADFWLCNWNTKVSNLCQVTCHSGQVVAWRSQTLLSSDFRSSVAHSTVSAFRLATWSQTYFVHIPRQDRFLQNHALFHCHHYEPCTYNAILPRFFKRSYMPSPFNVKVTISATRYCGPTSHNARTSFPRLVHVGFVVKK